MNQDPNIPGIGFGKPAEIIQPTKNVTVTTMYPMGLAGIGRPPYQVGQIVHLTEDGSLVTEIVERISTCAGCGDLMKTRDDPTAMCLAHGLIVCPRCAQTLKCSVCGCQLCNRCAHKDEQGRFVCDRHYDGCEDLEIEGGSLWSSFQNPTLNQGMGSLPMPTWGSVGTRTGYR